MLPFILFSHRMAVSQNILQGSAVYVPGQLHLYLTNRVPAVPVEDYLMVVPMAFVSFYCI